MGNDAAGLLGGLRGELSVASQQLDGARALEGATAAADLQRYLGFAPDVIVQSVGTGVWVVYLDHAVDMARIESAVLRPLTSRQPGSEIPWPAQAKAVTTLGEAARHVLAGDLAVFQASLAGGVAIPAALWPLRTPAEPPTETAVQGPHDGLIEDLGTNVAILRHRLRHPGLRLETFYPGGPDGPKGLLLYVEGRVRPDLLARVRRAVRRVRAPVINDVQMLAPWLAPWQGALFPVLGLSGRPDTVVAALLAGRVTLLVDGSPLALLAPNVLSDLLHVPEDYYQTFIAATANRVLRVLGLFLTLVSSPVYVALLTMNQELVPTPLFTSIIQSRQSVPLAPLPEVLLLEVIIEVIREAGLRLPGNLGQPVAIVGAVIIGQSAVTAGLISAPTIVVVAFAFISSFVIPQPNLAASLRYLRFPLILTGAAFGILGVTAGVLVIFAYLCSLTSFGEPYLVPFSPGRQRGLQDALWRVPLARLRSPMATRRSARFARP